MIFVDTHCHVDDPALSERLPQLLASAADAGIEACIIPGVAPAGWQSIVTLSQQHGSGLPRLLPAFGVHPMHADLLDQNALHQLEELTARAVAIGEIGLDYAPTSPAKEVQQHAFRAQLRLALRHDLPVLIHCRRAFGDLLAIVRDEGGTRCRGVMHAFSGSVETALQCVKMGLYVSVCGTVTYRNAVKPVAVAAQTPLEHLLLETDAPDLAPEPRRGEANVPENLLLTARRVAEVKGVTLEEVAGQTTRNARRLFRY